jgi:F-type H+-transporting ATPase subunit b
MFEAEFWVAVSFLIFIGVIVWLKVPGKIAAALDRRAAQIGRELEEARSIRAEAEQLLTSYRERRAQAEQDAQDIVARARADAEAMQHEMRQQAEAQIARRTRLAEDNIRRAEAQAIQEVRSRAADIAVAAARDLLRTRIDADRDRQLIEQGIDALGTKLH